MRSHPQKLVHQCFQGWKLVGIQSIGMIVFDNITLDDAITSAGHCVGVIQNPGKAKKLINKWKRRTRTQISDFLYHNFHNLKYNEMK